MLPGMPREARGEWTACCAGNAGEGGVKGCQNLPCCFEPPAGSALRAGSRYRAGIKEESPLCPNRRFPILPSALPDGGPQFLFYPSNLFVHTLRTINSCSKSADAIRGVPIACTTSWQRLIVANTSP